MSWRKGTQKFVNKDSTCDALYDTYKQLAEQKQEFLTLTPFKLSGSLPSKEIYEKVIAELENERSAIFNQLMFSTDIQLDKVNIRFTPQKDNVDLINGKILFGVVKNKPEIYINKDLIGQSGDFVSSTPGVVIYSATQSKIDSLKASLNLYYLKILPVEWNKTDIANATATPQNKIAPGESSSNEGGLFYNIPLACKVYIQKGEHKNWSEASVMFPQWGVLGRLSDKMTKQVIELNPLYGNLKTLQAESKTITPEQLKTFGESLAQARDVFYTDPITKMERRIKFLETKDKLSEAEGNELSELKKQKDLLQAQKEILELKKAIKEFEQE